MKKLIIIAILIFAASAFAGPPAIPPMPGGDVSISGTPAQYYWAEWVNGTTVKGTAVTASKPVCTDANGSPAVCAGTEGVWQTSVSFGTGVETALGNAPNATGGILTYANAAVALSPLTGYTIGSGGDTVAATDTILQAFQKLAGNYSTSFPACTPGSGDCAVNVTPNSAALTCASGYACFGTGAAGVLPYFKTAGGTSYQLASLDGPEALTNKSIAGTTGTFTGNLVGLTPSIIVTKPSGTSTDVPSETVLTHADDGSASNAYVGMTLYNITDGVSGTVTASTSTTITVAAGSMSWANTNVYQLGPGPGQSGSVFYVGTAGTIRHPATAGYTAAYYVDVAGIVVIDMASDSMIFQGLLNGAYATLGAGDSIESPATQGSSYVIHNKSATSAVGWGSVNTWTDGGAS